MRRAGWAVVVVVVATVLTAERAAVACTSPCAPVPLSIAGKTLPAGLTALPLHALMLTGATDGVTLRRGETVIETRVGDTFPEIGTLVASEPLSPGDYELLYPQPPCNATPGEQAKATFTVGDTRPRPQTTGTMRARTYVVPKAREATPDDLQPRCGFAQDPRETYDRVVAEITLEVAPELVPYLPVTAFDSMVATPRSPENTAFSPGSPGWVKDPVWTFTTEIRCDELRSKGESLPGKYTYSYAARFAGETTALPPASVSFDLLCPASAKTPIYDANGLPIPQPNDEADGCAIGPRAREGAPTFGAFAFVACALTALRRRRGSNDRCPGS